MNRSDLRFLEALEEEDAEVDEDSPEDGSSGLGERAPKLKVWRVVGPSSNTVGWTGFVKPRFCL